MICVAIVKRIKDEKVWVTIDRLTQGKHTYGPCPMVEGIITPTIKRKRTEVDKSTVDHSTAPPVVTVRDVIERESWYGGHPGHTVGTGAHAHDPHVHEYGQVLAVGDKVYVGFEDGAHDRPVILGRIFRPQSG